MLLALIGAFVAWQLGVFGGGRGTKKLDVKVNTGAITQPAQR